MKPWKTLFYGLGIIPYVFVLSVMTFYLHAGWMLGQLPRYDHPDPQELGIYSWYSPVIDITSEIWLFSLLAWLIAVIVYVNIRKRKAKWSPVIFSAAGQVTALLLLVSWIMTWYMD